MKSPLLRTGSHQVFRGYYFLFRLNDFGKLGAADISFPSFSFALRVGQNFVILV